jgi:hypothetical protein
MIIYRPCGGNTMPECQLCVYSDTDRAKGWKNERQGVSGGVPGNEGIIRFESLNNISYICAAPECLKVLPRVFADPLNGFLSAADTNFILTINGKDYTFANDGRILRGVPSRIRELLKNA